MASYGQNIRSFERQHSNVIGNVHNKNIKAKIKLQVKREEVSQEEKVKLVFILFLCTFVFSTRIFLNQLNITSNKT